MVFTSSEVKFRKLKLEALPVSAAFTANHVSNHVGKGEDRFPIPNQFYIPLSHGGHNKKLCFCTASLALNSRLGEAYRAKTKLFILLRINMVPRKKRSISLFLMKMVSLAMRLGLTFAANITRSN